MSSTAVAGTTLEEQALGKRLADLARRIRLTKPPSRGTSSLTAERLQPLLEALRQARGAVPRAAPSRPAASSLSPDQLRGLLERIAIALADVRERGDFIDPWAVAGLKTREVRNAAALAWLLNPRESHGLGARPLRSVVGHLIACDPAWAPDLSVLESCTVRTEYRPQDSARNRVDLALYCPGFLLFLEVKIAAPEGPEQLRRYLESAEAQAGALQRAARRLLAEQR